MKFKHISLRTATSFIDQGVVSGVNFLMGILLAKLMGVEQYGVFAFLWMIIFFVSSIHQAFIITPMYTLLPKHNNTSNYVGSLIGLQLIFSCLVFGLTYLATKILIGYFPEYDFYLAEFAVAGVTSIYVLHDFFRRLCFGLKLSTLALIIDILGYGLQPIILLIFHYLGELNLTITFLSIASTLCLGVVVQMIYQKASINFSLKPVICSHWRFSKYLVGTSFLQWLSGNFFIAVSAGIIGPVAVGVIRMSQNVVGVLHVLFLAFENTIPLKAAEVLQSNGKIKMLQYIGQKAKQSVLVVLVLLGTIACLSKLIITHIYGPEYLKYQYVLFAFCTMYIFVFIGTFLRFVIRTLEQNKIIFISYIVTTIFSLLLAKLMVQQLNIVGVLLGLIISQIITNGVYIIALKSEIKWILK